LEEGRVVGPAWVAESTGRQTEWQAEYLSDKNLIFVLSKDFKFSNQINGNSVNYL